MESRRAATDAGDGFAGLLARDGRDVTGCAPGPTPATGMPPRNWPTCWPTAATWTGCARADAGDWDAAKELAYLLADRGDVDGLRAQIDEDGTPPGGCPTC